MRMKLFAYIKKKYKVEPEYPWSRYDTNAVFRHVDNKKWFAIRGLRGISEALRLGLQ